MEKDFLAIAILGNSFLVAGTLVCDYGGRFFPAFTESDFCQNNSGQDSTASDGGNSDYFINVLDNDLVGPCKGQAQATGGDIVGKTADDAFGTIVIAGVGIFL